VPGLATSVWTIATTLRALMAGYTGSFSGDARFALGIRVFGFRRQSVHPISSPRVFCRSPF